MKKLLALLAFAMLSHFATAQEAEPVKYFTASNPIAVEWEAGDGEDTFGTHPNFRLWEWIPATATVKGFWSPLADAGPALTLTFIQSDRVVYYAVTVNYGLWWSEISNVICITLAGAPAAPTGLRIAQ